MRERSRILLRFWLGQVKIEFKVGFYKLSIINPTFYLLPALTGMKIKCPPQEDVNYSYVHYGLELHLLGRSYLGAAVIIRNYGAKFEEENDTNSSN